jgi:hypothetical protein
MGRVMLEHVEDFIGEEVEVLGELTDSGRREHAGQAMRTWHAHGGDLARALGEGRSLVFESSDKPRTKGSRDAFLRGFVGAANLSLPAALRALLPTPEELSAVEDEEASDSPTSFVGALRERLFDVVLPPECPVAGDDHVTFSKLRFFDSCSNYRRYKKEKSWLPRLERYTANATRPTSHERAMLLQLFAPEYLAALAQVGDGLKQLTATSPPSPLVAGGKAAAGAAQGSGGGGGGGGKSSEREKASWYLEEASVGTFSGGAKRARKQQNQVRKAMRLLSKAQREGGGVGATPSIAGLAMDLYSACQVDLNANGRADRFCAVFNSHLELLAKEELITDLSDFYKQGAGDPVAFAASCVLLEDFMTTGDDAVAWARRSAGAPTVQPRGRGGREAAAAAAAAARARPAPAAHFRFGHSETVMPFISVMGLYQEVGAPSLEDYYSSELAAGTSNLLNSTRARFAALRAASGQPPPAEGEEEASFSHSATPAATASSSPSATARAPDRALPPGFSSGLVMALKHPWSGARLVPMAANVQWLLYDCGEAPPAAEGAPEAASATAPPAAPASAARPGAAVSAAPAAAAAMRGFWVKMLHNEREIPFPACGAEGASADAAPFGLRFPCPWDKVKDFYRSVVYGSYGIKSCSARDWLDMCGELDSSSCREPSMTKIFF